MMIRLNWKEFVQAACERLAQLNPSFTLSEPSFRTDHGSYNGGVGDSYDLPDFVDFDTATVHLTIPDEIMEHHRRKHPNCPICGTDAPNLQSPPETDSSSTAATDTPL